MSTSVDQAFIKNFEVEIYAQFRQMGSVLRNTVCIQNDVIGASTTFQKVGHDPVECVLLDYYAGDWIDQLDEIKTNVNERHVATCAGAYMLGRKINDMIIRQLQTSQVFAGSDSDALTKEKVLVAFEMLSKAGVPDDGQRFAVVGWKQWSDLLSIDEFSNADYIGEDELLWKCSRVKRWKGALWLPYSGLPMKDGVRSCFWYHKTAIGHAIGSEVKTDISWHSDRAAHFVNNMMRMGVCMIDATSIVTLRCKEI